MTGHVNKQNNVIEHVNEYNVTGHVNKQNDVIEYVNK